MPVVSGALVPVVSSRSTTYQNAGVGRRETVHPDGHPQVPGPGSVALVVAGGNRTQAPVGGLAAGRSRAQGPTGGAPAGRTGPRQGQVTTFTVKQWVEMVRDGAQHVKACCKEKNGVTFRKEMKRHGMATVRNELNRRHVDQERGYGVTMSKRARISSQREYYEAVMGAPGVEDALAGVGAFDAESVRGGMTRLSKAIDNNRTCVEDRRVYTIPCCRTWNSEMSVVVAEGLYTQ